MKQEIVSKSLVVNSDKLEQLLGEFPDFKNWVLNGVKFENDILCIYFQTQLENKIENKDSVRVELALYNASINFLNLNCNNLVSKINEIDKVLIYKNQNNFLIEIISKMEGCVLKAEFSNAEFTHMGLFNQDARIPLIYDFLKLIAK